MKKAVVFGGSFNPIHYGHLFAVEYLRNNFDYVIVVPCYDHVFEKKIISYNHRFNMVKLALGYNIWTDSGDGLFDMEDSIGIILSNIEEHLGGKSVMIRTIRELKKYKFFSGVDFSFSIGRDDARELDKWHEYENLILEAKPFIIENSIFEQPKLFSHIHSTYIRFLLRNGFVGEKDFIPPAVYEYIKKNKLYEKIEVSTHS